MRDVLRIIIWDLNAERISVIDRNLCLALQNRGIRGEIICMSEPPLLARMGLSHKVPVLEIGGMHWSHTPGEEISIEACEKLLSILFDGSQCL